MVSINYAELYQNADQSVINNTPLPPDNYNVVIESAELKQAQSSQRYMYVVRFSVEDGPHAGRKVTNNFVIVDDNPTALGIHFRHMSAMGIPTDWLLQNPASEQVCQALVGRRCNIRVDIQKNNTDFNEVKSIRPATGAPAAAAPQAQQQFAPQQPQQQQFAPPPGQYGPPAGQPQQQPQQQPGIPQPQFGPPPGQQPQQAPQFAPPPGQPQFAQQGQQPQFAPPPGQAPAPTAQPQAPQYAPPQVPATQPGYPQQGNPPGAPQQAQFAPPPQLPQDPSTQAPQGQQQAPPPF